MDWYSLLIILSVMIISSILFLKKKQFVMDKLLLIFAFFCPAFFSVFGIIFEKYQNESYLLSYILFYIFFLFTLFLIIFRKNNNKNNKLINSINETLEKHEKVFNTLGWIAIVLKLCILIYPTFNFFSLFTPWKLTYTFSASEYFSTRLFARSDLLSKIISISTTTLSPFLYILLYNKKDKPVKFSLIYIFYYYIDYVNESYIQRNKIIALVVFLLCYLIYENIIKKRKLVIIIPIIGFSLVIMTNFLYSYRLGGENKNLSFEDSLVSIIESESSTQKYLDVCNSISPNISFPKMFISIVSAPFFFLPDVNFPTLSYYFTETITGVSYGGTNYYILLPGFFEEAVMIFGKSFAFLYGVFVALFLGVLYNFYKRIDYAKFFLLNIIINFGVACRGTLQSFMLQQINLLCAFIVVVFFVRLFSSEGGIVKK